MIQSENISELSSNYALLISINDPQRTHNLNSEGTRHSVTERLTVYQNADTVENI